MPFGRLWYGDANAVTNAIGYAMHLSRSQDAVIRVYDEAGNIMIEMLKPDQVSNEDRSARESTCGDDVAKPSVPAPNAIELLDANTTVRGCSRAGRRLQ